MSAVVRLNAPATVAGSDKPKPTLPAALGAAKTFPGVNMTVNAMVS